MAGLALLAACSGKPEETAKQAPSSPALQTQAALEAAMSPEQKAAFEAQLQLIQLQQQILLSNQVMQTAREINREASDSIRYTGMTTACSISGNCRVEVHEYPRY